MPYQRRYRIVSSIVAHSCICKSRSAVSMMIRCRTIVCALLVITVYGEIFVVKTFRVLNFRCVFNFRGSRYPRKLVPRKFLRIRYKLKLMFLIIRLITTRQTKNAMAKCIMHTVNIFEEANGGIEINLSRDGESCLKAYTGVTIRCVRSDMPENT